MIIDLAEILKRKVEELEKEIEEFEEANLKIKAQIKSLEISHGLIPQEPERDFAVIHSGKPSFKKRPTP